MRTVTGNRKVRILAWSVGITGALTCAVGVAFLLGFGVFTPFSLPCVALIASALLGALVASRQPRNSVGWVMCAGAIAGALLFLPLDYGYSAQVLHHGRWPLGGAALWVWSWAFAPTFGMYFPMLAVRFPDGRVLKTWRFVDWLAVAGTLLLMAGLFFAPPSVLRGFAPSTGFGLFQLLGSLIQNPVGSLVPDSVLAVLRIISLALISLAYVAAVASLIERFRHARSLERAQIKWFAYAGIVMAAALICGLVWAVLTSGVGFLITGLSLGDALIPLAFAAISFPLAVAIAILRYRLYDIDLIINRTLVYGGLTAILGAVYAAIVTFLNRLFISASGQKSDAAYVVTAFVVVFASSPVKDWLQRQVDRRIRHRSPTSVLSEFRADVEAVVSVFDVHRVARRLVDQAIEAFDAHGAALYLQPSEVQPAYSRGHLNGGVEIEIPLRYEDHQIGRLVMGGRRGDLDYTDRDRDLLQESADSVGEALALAADFGFQPLRRK